MFVWAEDEDRSGAETGMVPALLEDTAVTSGDTLQIPDNFPYIAGVMAGTDNASYIWIDGRLASPGIGGPGVNNFRIHKGHAGAIVHPGIMYDYFDNPLQVGEGPNGIAGDTITAYVDCTDYADNAVACYIALYVTDTRLPLMPHNITHVPKFTMAAIAAALTWEKKSIVLDDDIPVGRYLLWEADVTSVTGIAARMIVPGVPFRPAFVPRRAALNASFKQPNKCLHPGGIPFVYKGGTLNMKVEYCAEATDTALSGYLGLEYLGK